MILNCGTPCEKVSEYLNFVLNLLRKMAGPRLKTQVTLGTKSKN